MLPLRRCVKQPGILANFARCAALGIALSAAGCASDQERREDAYGHGQQAYNMRGPVAPQREAEPEVEDDGLPSQVPPPVKRAREPDDPREPYSPNYGAPARQAEVVLAPATTASLPRRVATY